MLERLRMPSKKQYDLVSDDGYDSRIPLHNDEAFTHGIPFTAKYIGTLDVPRPSSRVEIVAAMRRIRYEFKAKAIKKKKVNITISVEGVKITLRRKKRRVTLHKTDWSLDDSRNLVMHHPIYRIFYVSHDSQDLKIFSYIARDGSTNVFKCNVFKSYKKSQAMRIVRTIGQAFEVCHKISLHAAQQESNGNQSDKSSKATEETQGKETISVSSPERVTSTDRSPADSKPSTAPQSPRESYTNHETVQQSYTNQEMVPQLNRSHRNSQTAGSVSSSQPQSPKLGPDNFLVDMGPLPLTAQHKIQLLRLQVEQQQQQTQVAISQVHLLKDQLTAETTARIESQARTHNLLLQNRELLDHISALVRQMQELEASITGTNLEEYNLLKTPLQRIPMPEATSPEPSPIFIPGADLELSAISMGRDASFYDNSSIHINGEVHHRESPDSCHRDMSSDSLVQSFNVLPSDGTIWQTPPANMYGTSSTPSGGHANYGAIVHHGMNAGGFISIDAGYQRPNSLVRPVEHSGTVTVTSGGNPFVEDLTNNSNYMANGLSSSSSSSEKFDRENNNNSGHSHQHSHQHSQHSQHQQHPIQIITPLPAQDASGNRVDLSGSSGVGGVAAKLHPPPRVQRSSTTTINTRSPPSSTSSSSLGVKDLILSPDSNGNDSSNLSTSTSSSVSTSEKRNNSSCNNVGSSNISSTKLSTTEGGRETVATLSTDIKDKAAVTALIKRKEGAEPTMTVPSDTANQNLKNLNMNLKSLKSPHKRHSSTSAELYSNKAHSAENTKIAMQSSSDSKLSNVNRSSGGGVFDPKKPVHINVELAKS